MPSSEPLPPEARRARRTRRWRFALAALIVLAAADVAARLVTLAAFYAPLRRHPSLRRSFEAARSHGYPVILPGKGRYAFDGGDPGAHTWMDIGPGGDVRWRTYREVEAADFTAWPGGPRPPGAVRIAFSGSSTTWEGYPQAAGRAFDAGTGPGRVQIANLGMVGANLSVSRYLLERFLPALQADFVVVYEGFNEVEDLLIRRQSLRLGRALAGRGRRDSRPAAHDEFCRHYPSRGLWMLAREALGDPRLPPPCSAMSPGEIATLFACAEEGSCAGPTPVDPWRRTVERVRSLGSTPVLSTFAAPDYERLGEAERDFLETEIAYNFPFLADTRTYAAVLAELNRRLRALAAELDVPLVDVAAALPGDMTVFRDNCHRTERGLELHGRVVYEALRPRVEALLAARAAQAAPPPAR